MNFKLRSFLPFVLAAVASVGVAHASTFTGTVYNDASGNVVNPSTLGTALGSFTVSSFNFNVGPGYTAGNSNFTIGKFLSGGSNLVIDSTLANKTVASTEFVFTGSTYLVHGQSYSFTHDDGMTLSIDGVSYINTPAQTVAIASTFIYTGVTGNHSFNLDYASNSLSPSVLTGSFTPAATPEPSSFIMLGTGIIGAAGMVRRRFNS